MTPENKAKELVGKYKRYVPGYLGSSMLTNTEYPEVILVNAKQCALIAVEEIMIYYPLSTEPSEAETAFRKFWQEVKQLLQ